MTELAGKRIVVIGATGGLGSLISQQLHDAGAQLVLVGRSAEKLQALAIPAEMFTIDLLTPGSASAVITTIAAAGPIDGLVIAHGAVAFGRTEELDDETLSALVAINQTTPMQLIRAAIAPMRDAKAAGSEPFIVTITGIVSEAPTAGLAAYSAAKAGLAAFVSVLRRELRRDGIRVLDARPPHTETELSLHPLAGQAPAFGPGLAPQAVAERIVRGIVDGEADLPSTAFAE
jgi:short-subunit dehydrogenase